MQKLLLLILVFQSFELFSEDKIIKVNLESSHEVFASNNMNFLVFNFELKDGWHTYWKNAGDSGLPIEIEFSNDSNLILQTPIWDIPKVFSEKGITDYGYDKNFKIYTPITFRPGIRGKTEIKAKIKALVCKEICIPQDTIVSLVISLDSVSKQSTKTKYYIDYLKNIVPQNTIINNKIRIEGNKIFLSLEDLDGKIENKKIEFFPFENGVIKNKLNTQVLRISNVNYMVFDFDETMTKIPDEISGQIHVIDGNQTLIYFANYKSK